jgi:hypothetical protein
MPDETNTRAYLKIPASERLRLRLISQEMTEGSWSSWGGSNPPPGQVDPGQGPAVDVHGTYWVNHISARAFYRAQAQDAHGTWKDLTGTLLLQIAGQTAFVMPMLADFGPESITTGLTITSRQLAWADRPVDRRNSFNDDWEFVFNRKPGWNP